MNRVFFLAGVALLAAGAAQGQTPRPLKDYRDYALRRDGDAGRGRALFASTEKAACAACHTVDGQGGKAGPDLRAIGDEFSRRELIEAMLEPSAAIAVGYDATIVETHAGATFSGVIKQSNAEAVALMGADGQLVSVPRATIKAQRGSPVSLMPAGLHAGLSLAEFADLVDYLVSLKQPENSLRADRGMPEVIAELATPVPLRPLFAEALRFPAPVVRRPGEARTGLVWFGALPGARDTFLAVQQTGQIWRMERTAGVFSKAVFGDFSAEVFSQRGPNGLLGVAFHPQFAVNRK
jgi:putative heme-binding domain-containing protein